MYGRRFDFRAPSYVKITYATTTTITPAICISTEVFEFIISFPRSCLYSSRVLSNESETDYVLL